MSHDEVREPFWREPQVLLTGISSLLFAVGLGLAFVTADPILADPLGRPIRVSTLPLLLAIIVAGYHFARRGAYAIRTLSLDIDFLMTIAVLGAVAIEEYIEAASLAFLFATAELLETYAIERTRDSLRELMELAPRRARVKRDGETAELPVEEIAVGEVVTVRPGERIPMDGIVTDGSSRVNQAPITGESMPVAKNPSDAVYAGTVNGDGYLEVEVAKRATENTLARIIHLVEEAEAQKAPTKRFVDRFARYYTPSVVAVAVGVAIFPPLFGASFHTWFLRALSLLVIACPCALLISTPVSVVSAITSAARNGLLIKGGRYLEAMGEVGVIAFDKTGTLTVGEPKVTDVISLNDGSPQEVLRIAATVESRSEHPIAAAIMQEAEGIGWEEEGVTDFEALPGRGALARLNGTTYYIGTPELFEACHVEIPTDQLTRLQCRGKTTILVGTETEVLGIIAVADRVRDGAREMVARLKRMGYEVVMITGDNQETADAIAAELGITHYHAGLLPDEKVEEIRKLGVGYGGTAMVGDGINDAPALAAATVGIAMGAAGSDTALETADVALMADDLIQVPYLIALSSRARGVIRWNIWVSILIKFALAGGVFFGYVTLILAVLVGDMGASLAVIGNALRLARVKRN
ncbi:MAG: heavy metal translocating P-type ATPase [Candidatus Bipolaricaulia bacterium]